MHSSSHAPLASALLLGLAFAGCSAPGSTASVLDESRALAPAAAPEHTTRPANTSAPASAAAPRAVDALAELRREAARAFDGRAWADAAELYARIVDAEPSNAPAWFRRGFALHSLGDFAGSVRAFERSNELQPNGTVAYDVACARARLGETDVALTWLAKSVELGMRDLTALTMDDDLATLRALPAFHAIVERVQAAVHPCEARAESRQLDFWVGEWDVTTQAGAPAGSSRVERILDGCVLLEHWTGRNGSSGKSFSLYDAATKRWKQTWVDNAGELTEFAGASNAGGEMVFLADVPLAGGAGRGQRRMTFTSLDPARVRQLGELSKDGGTTWAVEYDFVYTRKP